MIDSRVRYTQIWPVGKKIRYWKSECLPFALFCKADLSLLKVTCKFSCSFNHKKGEEKVLEMCEGRVLVISRHYYVDYVD
jgi:hypothetical protein